MEAEDLIKKVSDDVRDLLIEKNRAYGNSALNGKPISTMEDLEYHYEHKK